MSARDLDAPLVSVIIPTRNRAHLLMDAIASVRAQTYAALEIIVVDDASDDGTVALVSSQHDVRLIQQPRAGQGAARNAGFAVARGEFVATLDSDDIWYPSFLAQCVSALQEGVHDLVFCNWDQQVPGAVDVGGLERYPEMQAWFPPGRSLGWQRVEPHLVRSLLFSTCPTLSSGTVFRRSVLPSTGPWVETLRIADDWCLAQDIASKSARSVGFTTQHLWHKRIDGQNICDGRSTIELLEHLQIADRAFLISRFGAGVSPAEVAQARLRLARNRLKLAAHMIQQESDWGRGSMLILQAVQDKPMVVARWLRDILRRRMSRLTSRVRGSRTADALGWSRGGS